MLNKNTQGFHNNRWSEAVHLLTQRQCDYVLVTVLATKGSTPRENGSKMVISGDDIYDTIGGGHLEFKVIEKARQLLLDRQYGQCLEQFSLGASLGQCCGGSVSVLFECQQNVATEVVFFGAGHVGHALVDTLSGLPIRVRWVDSRADLFPAQLPANAQIQLEAYPIDAVKDVAKNSIYIVLTHNHQLDFELTEQILKRNDALFLGVIGSKTKAKRFQLRLKHKGFSASAIEQMHCPVGLSDVTGKLPKEIAIAIAGQVIQQYQRLAETTQQDSLQWQSATSQLTNLVDA